MQQQAIEETETEHGPQKIGNVDADMVDEEAIDKALAKLKLPATGNTATKVRRLAAHFSKMPDEQLSICECGGESTADFDACPYCGALDETTEDDDPEDEDDDPEDEDEDDDPEDEDAEDPADIPGTEKPKGKPSGKAAAEPEKPAGGRAPAKPKPAEPVKPKAKTMAELYAETQAAKKPTAALAIVPAEQQTTAAEPLMTKAQAKLAATQTALDQSVARFNALKGDFMRSTWDLAQEIRTNYEKELWKARTDESGKPRYRVIQEFWAEEFQISHQWGYQMIEVATEFSKEEVQAVGPTKLAMVLKAPDAVNKRRLLTAAKGGASKRELEDMVRKLKTQRSVVAEGKAEKPDRVTVAFVPGRLTLKMFARAPRAVKEDNPKRAKRIGDQPWCDEILSNDVVCMYRLVQDAGGDLSLVVERRRLEKSKQPKEG